MTTTNDFRTVGVLTEVAQERIRQNEKWGEQNHANGTGPNVEWLLGVLDDLRATELSDVFRRRCQAHEPGTDTWLDILMEEVAEAFAEEDPRALRKELIQIAAVATQWVESIDRRSGAEVVR